MKKLRSKLTLDKNSDASAEATNKVKNNTNEEKKDSEVDVNKNNEIDYETGS